MTEQQELRIGEVAERAGVSVATLRYYEARGLLPPARREGGRRSYDETVLARLAVIRALKAAGFALDEIRRLLTDDDVRVAGSRQELVARRLQDVRRTIAGLQEVERALEDAVDCGCISLENCDRILTVAASRRAKH